MSSSMNSRDDGGGGGGCWSTASVSGPFTPPTGSSAYGAWLGSEQLAVCLATVTLMDSVWTLGLEKEAVQHGMAWHGEYIRAILDAVLASEGDASLDVPGGVSVCRRRRRRGSAPLGSGFSKRLEAGPLGLT